MLWSVSTVLAGLVAGASAAVHPGLLHSAADFTRIQGLVNGNQEPFRTGWNKLVARTNVNHQPSPKAIVCRGCATGDNYPTLYRDIHTAYANVIYWKVTGNAAYAAAAVRAVDQWSSTLTKIDGNSNRALAAGIYGYQFANVVEILRGYSGWTGLAAATKMLVNVFYSVNDDFLRNHYNTPNDHYWANWDLCNLASVHAIGVVSDNQTKINYAVNYFKTGIGNGAINKAIWALHTESGTGKVLGQSQEAGRDQGHALLVMALLGTLAQQSYNQGEDLFALNNNRILAGIEYAFKYNSGQSVPFTTYVNSVHGTHTAISPSGRGEMRPIAELVYAHYAKVKRLDASWTDAYRQLVLAQGGGAEGGGGDYGPNSGGYDQLGFGTILFRRP